MKKKARKKQNPVKPDWKNVYDPDYMEYFVTQAQLSKSIRRDGIVHLTLYDEHIIPLQGKTKKPVIERRIKTTLIIPDKALDRIRRFLNKIGEEGSKDRTHGGEMIGESAVKEGVIDQEQVKTSKAETSYIR